MYIYIYFVMPSVFSRQLCRHFMHSNEYFTFDTRHGTESIEIHFLNRRLCIIVIYIKDYFLLYVPNIVINLDRWGCFIRAYIGWCDVISSVLQKILTPLTLLTHRQLHYVFPLVNIWGLRCMIVAQLLIRTSPFGGYVHTATIYWKGYIKQPLRNSI